MLTGINRTILGGRIRLAPPTSFRPRCCQTGAGRNKVDVHPNETCKTKWKMGKGTVCAAPAQVSHSKLLHNPRQPVTHKDLNALAVRWSWLPSPRPYHVLAKGAGQTLEDHGWSMVLGTVVSNAIEVWIERCWQAHRKKANSQDYPKNRGEEWRSSSTEAKAALYAGPSHEGALFSMKLEAGIRRPPPHSGARFQQSTSCCRQSRFQILFFPSMLHSLSTWQGKNDSG